MAQSPQASRFCDMPMSRNRHPWCFWVIPPISSLTMSISMMVLTTMGGAERSVSGAQRRVGDEKEVGG